MASHYCTTFTLVHKDLETGPEFFSARVLGKVRNKQGTNCKEAC